MLDQKPLKLSTDRKKFHKKCGGWKNLRKSKKQQFFKKTLKKFQEKK